MFLIIQRTRADFGYLNYEIQQKGEVRFCTEILYVRRIGGFLRKAGVEPKFSIPLPLENLRFEWA
jgi:hypothetical protein